MKQEVAALARYRLSRAREAFAEGEHLLAQRAFMGAVSRFYYAAFYGARALLATRQLDSSKHSGVISLNLVLPGNLTGREILIDNGLSLSFPARGSYLEAQPPVIGLILLC